jgi:hypothetical protein
MNTYPLKRVYLPAILMLLTGIGSFHVLAAEPAAMVIEDSNPAVMRDLIGRILEDPSRDYSSVRGPDDCSNETLYQGTKELLGEYVADPVENQEALLDYILSSKEQCDCTLAIIGMNVNILLKDLGSDISQVPCR